MDNGAHMTSSRITVDWWIFMTCWTKHIKAPSDIWPNKAVCVHSVTQILSENKVDIPQRSSFVCRLWNIEKQNQSQIPEKTANFLQEKTYSQSVAFLFLLLNALKIIDTTFFHLQRIIIIKKALYMLHKYKMSLCKLILTGCSLGKWTCGLSWDVRCRSRRKFS